MESMWWKLFITERVGEKRRTQEGGVQRRRDLASQHCYTTPGRCTLGHYTRSKVVEHVRTVADHDGFIRDVGTFSFETPPSTWTRTGGE
jgi:hypothetical protein